MNEKQRRNLILTVTVLVIGAPVFILLSSLFMPIVNNLFLASSDAVLIDRFRMLKAEQPAYHKALGHARQELTAQNMQAPTVTAELAGASLQNSLQDLVTQAGANIGSSQILPAQTTAGLQVISVSISFSLPEAKLANFLRAIDAQTPFLKIQSLDVRAINSSGAGNSQTTIQMQAAEFREAP